MHLLGRAAPSLKQPHAIWASLFLVSTLLRPFALSSEPRPFQEIDHATETPTATLGDNHRGLSHGAIERIEQYLPDFLRLDRSILGRAPVPTALENNIPQGIDIRPDAINHWVFPADTISKAVEARAPHAQGSEDDHGTHALDLRSETPETYDDHDGPLDKRQQSNSTSRRTPTVYITINVCLQPSFATQTLRLNPPQLVLWVSTVGRNQNPGPSNRESARPIVLQEGFASFEVTTRDSVYVGVAAPQIEVVGQKDIWNYNIAASIDGAFHGFNTTDTSLYLIDSDPSAALLVTSDLIDAKPKSENFTDWLSRGPPLSFFAQNINETSINGVRHSYCGLANAAKLSVTNINPSLPFPPPINENGGEVGITYNQPGGEMGEQQIYMPGLNASTTYYGFLAQTGNSTAAGTGVVGGGGIVFEVMNFTTKRDPNCAVIFNLTFCSNVNYAVPANPNNFSPTELTALYDNSTQAKYQNFTYSLQQIPCNTTASAQYSLVKTCDDCAAAYKTWLCAVSIPKCEDFTVTTSAPDDPAAFDYLMPRNLAQKPLPGQLVPDINNSTELGWLATNSSRNADIITDRVQPGPYKEVLPCEDLCYDLVRACPAALGFACPQAGRGLEASYGRRGVALGGGYKCNAPGAVYYKNGAQRMFGDVRWVIFTSGLVMMVSLAFA